MTKVKILAFVSVGVLAMLLPPAQADDSNQKTVFTFSGPVEIPGQVLSAGTYVFKLADSSSDRNIVQVYDKDENHLYGTFLAIPDYRLKPSGKPIITFEERAAGAPEAIRAWFYPGNNYGHEFVYPKVKAVELARANKKPVPSMPTELATNTTKPTPTLKEPEVAAMRQAPLKAQRPQQPALNTQPKAAPAAQTPPPTVIEEVEIAQVFTPSPDLAKALPGTASLFPVVTLLGLLALLAAALLRLARASSQN